MFGDNYIEMWYICVPVWLACGVGLAFTLLVGVKLNIVVCGFNSSSRKRWQVFFLSCLWVLRRPRPCQLSPSSQCAEPKRGPVRPHWDHCETLWDPCEKTARPSAVPKCLPVEYHSGAHASLHLLFVTSVEEHKSFLLTSHAHSLKAREDFIYIANVCVSGAVSFPASAQNICIP